jgi:hypothetical protein
MALKISSNNIPYAFSHIMELSQLPTESTYEVIFNNKTIEQAVDTTAAYTTGFGEEPEYWWEEEEEEDWWREEDMLDDSDALDKAKYQVENPNAIITPWGPALAPEAVDAIIDDSPGVQELLGLTNEEIAEVTESADAIIDASGDNLDEILSQADATAMAENLDPNEVGTGILDEMMNNQPPDTTVVDVKESQALRRVVGGVKVSASPRIPEEWQDYLYSGDATEGWEPDEYWTTEEDVVPDDDPGLWDRLASFVMEPGAQYGADLAEKEEAKETAAQADTEFLEGLLTSDLSKDDIMDKIREELEAGGLFPESVISWVQSHEDWTYGSPIYRFGQGAMTLATSYQEDPSKRSWLDKQNREDLIDGGYMTNEAGLRKYYNTTTAQWEPDEDWQARTTSIFDAEKADAEKADAEKADAEKADAEDADDEATYWDDMPDDRLDIAMGFLNDNLKRAFYQKFAGRPGAGRYQIRSQMDNIFADSLTLFHLYGGETNFKDSWAQNWQDYQKAVTTKVGEVADTGPLEGAYNTFLNRYMADPYGMRSGSQFDAAVSEVGRLLNLYENQILPEGHDMATFILKGGLPGISNEDVQRLPWVIGMFGEGKGDAARRNLAHLYRTGGSKSYYAQQIHSVMDEMWDYWSAIGMSEADIFQRMTAPGTKEDLNVKDQPGKVGSSWGVPNVSASPIIPDDNQYDTNADEVSSSYVPPYTGDMAIPDELLGQDGFSVGLVALMRGENPTEAWQKWKDEQNTVDDYTAISEQWEATGIEQ